VKLSVVSGRPISFITQLYEPKYVTRPFSELAENQAVAPVVLQGRNRRRQGWRGESRLRDGSSVPSKAAQEALADNMLFKSELGQDIFDRSRT
jgi:hypothetical protein